MVISHYTTEIRGSHFYDNSRRGDIPIGWLLRVSLLYEFALEAYAHDECVCAARCSVLRLVSGTERSGDKTHRE